VDRAVLEFHCCLSVAHCQFELLQSDNDDYSHEMTTVVVCTLGKDTELFNVGESALPLRLIDEDRDLTPFHSPSQSNDYLETTRLHHAMFQSIQDMELRRQAAGYNARITDPFFCLRETIADLWKNVYRRPEVPQHCVCNIFIIIIISVIFHQ